MSKNRCFRIVRAFIKMIRPHQWYKNLLVIVPAIFSLSLFKISIWPILLTTFTSACLVSGANYIINDIRDLERDRRHPSKRLRPLPSNLISIREATILSILTAFAGFSIAYHVSLNVLLLMILLFLNTQLYSFLLKSYALIDVTALSLNYVIRAVVGAYAISVPASPWLVVGIFSLALLLSFGKRVGELLELGGGAETHRTALKYYRKIQIKRELLAASLLTVIVYIVYSLHVHGVRLILTIPFAIYLVAFYTNIVWRDVAVASNPSMLFRYWKFTSAFTVWLILVVVFLYLL
ncbi:UbiA prenyltransferase family protein [Candidatus Bathyarchaeota archaeon]|nr:UbiA prenyltransferase family protein [Candidatus Bathyarchaeota archaeon]MBS7613657.1 UbiA prenyltransferase family protein [Candidatus Bathyarchaeota archaeon]MBS7618037.1 UbiA prenyltransferase family protein [Candidatus Bathyarchaeota archaeon]